MLIMEQLSSWDPAESLKDDAAISAFLDDALETANPVHIMAAISAVFRARGNHEGAARLLNAAPDLDLIQSSLAELGFRLHASRVRN
jgi:hypothetical protein